MLCLAQLRSRLNCFHYRVACKTVGVTEDTAPKSCQWLLRFNQNGYGMEESGTIWSIWKRNVPDDRHMEVSASVVLAPTQHLFFFGSIFGRQTGIYERSQNGCWGAFSRDCMKQWTLQRGDAEAPNVSFWSQKVKSELALGDVWQKKDKFAGFAPDWIVTETLVCFHRIDGRQGHCKISIEPGTKLVWVLVILLVNWWLVGLVPAMDRTVHWEVGVQDTVAQLLSAGFTLAADSIVYGYVEAVTVVPGYFMWNPLSSMGRWNCQWLFSTILATFGSCFSPKAHENRTCRSMACGKI